MGGTFWSLMDEEWGYEGIRNMEEKREEKGCGMKVSCVFRDSCPVIFFFFNGHAQSPFDVLILKKSERQLYPSIK